MEYWLFTENNINPLLDCQLYSATNQDINHFTKPRIVKTLIFNTVFEAVESISMLDKEKKYILNILDNQNRIYFEVIKHIIKNKKELPHIQLFNTLNNNVNDIIATISYGIDYIYIIDVNIDYIQWIVDFRNKGLYKAKIIISDTLHDKFIKSIKSVNYDGVVFSNKGILGENLA